MRRWFIVFLLLLVQLQFVWGAAASYCGHENSAAATSHFGHHEHRHQGGDGPNLSPGEDGKSFGFTHVDCESCHLGTSGTLPASAIAVAQLPKSDYHAAIGLRFNSHVPSAPERPDRIAHVAAA